MVHNSIKMKYQSRWCYFNLLIHKILQKDAQKGDFWNSLDPFWGFILKIVPGIHDPRISGLPFGTKNHEMWGPPVLTLGLIWENTVVKPFILSWNIDYFWVFCILAKVQFFAKEYIMHFLVLKVEMFLGPWALAPCVL